MPEFTGEQLQLITNTVAKGASPDELKLFLYRCKIMGLNPLKPGQIHFVKYGTSPGTIVVGIEGFRSIAARTGKMSGIKRGVIKENGKLIGAWAEIYRKDWDQPAREEVPLIEYNTNKGPWAKMPETMIKKVAEAAALRMAFPDDLGGVYEQAEMAQAETSNSRIVPEQPEIGEVGQESTVYYIPFGKFKGRTLEQVGPKDLAAYIDYIETKAQKDGQTIQGQVLDFINRASDMIAAFENAPLESENN